MRTPYLTGPLKRIWWPHTPHLRGVHGVQSLWWLTFIAPLQIETICKQYTNVVITRTHF